MTDEMGLVLVLGDIPQLATEHVVHPTTALGTPATYLWVESESKDDLLRELKENGLAELSEEELEAVRIANGVPRWGRDMGFKTIPQEVGIDATAVHFDKGCYVGQEAMAKIHFRGKVNRRLAVLEPDTAVQVGDEVSGSDGKLGVITSVARDGDTVRALAVVRRTVEPGANVAVGGAEARVAG
jgi:tRNA-modifying protein YgfZ